MAMLRSALAAVIAAALLSIAGPSYSASPPAITRADAHQLHCHGIGEANMGGPKDDGVLCREFGRLFYILKYRNPDKAERWWKNWITPGGYFVRKGSVFMLDEGGRSGHHAYTLKWSRYFKRHVGGELIEGRAADRSE
jgi:hypothetical protein